MGDPLIYVRAIHFAAGITAVGAIFFSVFIAEPAFFKAEAGARSPTVLRAQFAWLVWIGLAVALLSGAAWFVLVAQSMSDTSFFPKACFGRCFCKPASATHGSRD
jgi:uncharacterized membrane protein